MAGRGLRSGTDLCLGCSGESVRASFRGYWKQAEVDEFEETGYGKEFGKQNIFDAYSVALIDSQVSENSFVVLGSQREDDPRQLPEGQQEKAARTAEN